ADLIRNQDQTYVFTRTHGLDRFYFTSAGRLDHIVDRNGYQTSLAYDANSRLHQVADAVGHTLTFTYTSSLLTAVGDNTGRQVAFAYTSGELTGATDMAGQTTTFAYGAAHRMLTSTDPLSGLVTNDYDSY